jgi:hypothetical protein
MNLYVENFSKAYAIPELPILAHRYNELSKLALHENKLKRAEKYCEKALLLYQRYFPLHLGGEIPARLEAKERL